MRKKQAEPSHGNGNNRTSIAGTYRLFGAFDQSRTGGYKGWIDAAFKACYSPLLPIAFPALLILLNLLVVEKVIREIKSKITPSEKGIDRSAERKLKEFVQLLKSKQVPSGSGAEDKPRDRIEDHEEQEEVETFHAEAYIGNLSSKTFHLPECRWAKRINEKNLIRLPDKGGALAKGMTACKTCNP